MVWAGISYGQRTQLHFINGNLNAQRYRDEILRPIVVSFISRHHLMFQHDNARPHVARICTQWKLKMSQFFHGLHTHQIWHLLTMFGMLWTDMHDSVFQFPPISSNIAQPLKRSGTTFCSTQSTAWSTLYVGDLSHCLRQMVVTPDTDWCSDPRPYLFLRYLWSTDAYLYSQSCEIHRLGPN